VTRGWSTKDHTSGGSASRVRTTSHLTTRTGLGAESLGVVPSFPRADPLDPRSAASTSAIGGAITVARNWNASKRTQ
jgi:hypothetical protein